MSKPVVYGNPGPPAVDFNLRGTYRSVAQQTFRESMSPLDIFDWKFERYLTPWIVRITWIAVLIIAGLWLSFVMISLLLSFLPEVASRGPAMEPFDTPFSRSPNFNSSRFSSDSSWLWSLAFRVFVGITAFVGTIIWLLWIRVLLESAIVIFNIAKSIASIDAKTLVADSKA